MAKSRKQKKGAAAYGREALSEWGDALRYGARALSARLGSGNGNGSHGNGSHDDETDSEVPFPIQESIDVAVPLGGAFELASQFLDFPKYMQRVDEVEEADETHFVFAAKVGGRHREMEVEIVDERTDERIEWECDGQLEHSGVLTFHPLAPRLTRLELTIERQPEGAPERLSRRIHLPDRVIQSELHRFKAHAELLHEDFEDYVPEQVEEDEPEPVEEDVEEDEPVEEDEQVEEDELEPA